jgi:hypothetical protein
LGRNSGSFALQFSLFWDVVEAVLHPKTGGTGEQLCIEEPPQRPNGGLIAAPTAYDGVGREAVSICRRSKTQISFVLKIEKQNVYSCSPTMPNDVNRQLTSHGKRYFFVFLVL